MGSSRRDPLQAEECYHNINELRRSLNITQTFTPGEDSPFDPGRLRELGVKTGGSGGRHELQAVLFNVRGQSRDLSKRAATATLQTTTPRPPGAVSKLTRTDPLTSSCATFSDCACRLRIGPIGNYFWSFWRREASFKSQNLSGPARK
jgi:hypothetical protein